MYAGAQVNATDRPAERAAALSFEAREAAAERPGTAIPTARATATATAELGRYLPDIDYLLRSVNDLSAPAVTGSSRTAGIGGRACRVNPSRSGFGAASGVMCR